MEGGARLWGRDYRWAGLPRGRVSEGWGLGYGGRAQCMECWMDVVVVELERNSENLVRR